jgi:hypothetical protein
LRYIVKNVYYEDIVLLSMEIPNPVPAKVLRSSPGPGQGQPPPGETTAEILSRIKQRGVLYQVAVIKVILAL